MGVSLTELGDALTSVGYVLSEGDDALDYALFEEEYDRIVIAKNELGVNIELIKGKEHHVYNDISDEGFSEDTYDEAEDLDELHQINTAL